jgi:archaemetzincin
MDPWLSTILQKAEVIFAPKKILTIGDWLRSNREIPQSFNLYNRPEVRNNITPQRKVIYFNVIDERITEEFLGKLKTYCEAFFLGMKIEIIRPKKTFLELMKEYKIPSRGGYIYKGSI